MPNGHDRNWMRLCAEIDGYRLRYGQWPACVRLPEATFRNLREDLFTPESFATIRSHVRLVGDDMPIVAEGVEGTYSYGAEGFPRKHPDPDARDWLGVVPDRK